MIHDAPGQYPRSCVYYTRFRCTDCQQMFARHRQREWILQQELGQATGAAWDLKRAQLKEVEAQLIYMVSNICGVDNWKQQLKGF